MDGEINSVTDILAAAQRLGSVDHAHIRWLWRGQADFGWDLKPGVYRKEFLPAGIKNEEDERLLKERHYAQDFRVEAARLLGPKSDAEMYFTQQHYGMPTRLLDWSNSALAGLFFAVSDQSDELRKKNGAVFVIDGYQLAPTQNAPEKEYRGIVTSRHPWFDGALRRIFNWDNGVQFPNYMMAIRPDQIDIRMSRQRSCFTFHVPGHEQLVESRDIPKLWRYRVPAASKPVIEQELLTLGIDAFSIYEDIDHLARRLKRIHQG